MSGLTCPQEFCYDDESSGTAGSRWVQWFRDFEIYMVAANVTKASQRRHKEKQRCYTWSAKQQEISITGERK